MNYQIIDIKTITTPEDGALSFFEAEREVPFEIRRIYYIHSAHCGVQRGGHAHRMLRQLLFCPYGAVCMCLDDGHEKVEVLLDNPAKGLLLEAGIWRDMFWQQDNSVLCVAASDYYDAADYIRDYDEFLRFVQEGKQ